MSNATATPAPLTALAKFKQDVHDAATTAESSVEMERRVMEALTEYESCVDPVVTDRERILTEVFAAYNHIPAGNPSWTESQAAVGMLLDTIQRGYTLLAQIAEREEKAQVAEAEKQIV